MGSAVLTLMVFLGIMLILRSVLFGIIPYLKKRKMNRESSGEERMTEEKEQD